MLNFFANKDVEKKEIPQKSLAKTKPEKKTQDKSNKKTQDKSDKKGKDNKPSQPKKKTVQKGGVALIGTIANCKSNQYADIGHTPTGPPSLPGPSSGFNELFGQLAVNPMLLNEGSHLRYPI